MVKRKKPGTSRSASLGGGRKSILVVLFIPSVERDGITPIDQDDWVGDEYFAIRQFEEV